MVEDSWGSCFTQPPFYWLGRPCPVYGTAESYWWSTKPRLQLIPRWMIGPAYPFHPFPLRFFFFFSCGLKQNTSSCLLGLKGQQIYLSQIVPREEYLLGEILLLFKLFCPIPHSSRRIETHTHTNTKNWFHKLTLIHRLRRKIRIQRVDYTLFVK